MTTTDSPSNVSLDALPLAPGAWTLDPNHSSVGFTIRHLGVSKVRGRFSRFETAVTIGDTLESTSVAATIDMASLDTGNPDRDAHVLSPDIVDVTKRPLMSFRSTRIDGRGETWRMDGELTIGDVTQPVSLDVELGGIESFVDGTRHAGFEATGQIRRSDFGIDLALPPGVSTVALGDVIKIDVDLQLIEPSAQ